MSLARERMDTRNLDWTNYLNDTSGVPMSQTPTNVDFSKNTKGLGNFQLGLGAVNTGLGAFNAYLGHKSYKLAKEKFGFEKAATNANLVNQATTHNNARINGGKIGLSLEGNNMNQTQRDQHMQYIADTNLSTKPIG